MNVDTLPVSIVVLRNLDDVGYGDSWTCPTYILSRELIGQQGGDEDPLPPDGGNPHPLPHIHEGFWHDDVLGNIPMEQVVINPHNEHLGAPYEDVHEPTVVENEIAGNNVEIQTEIVVNANNEMQVDEAIQENNDTQMDYIPLSNDEHQSQQVHPVSSPVFVPANVSMDYEGNPHIDNAADNLNAGTQADNMSDSISALQGLIGNLVTNAHEIIPKLGGSKIVNAKCNIVDVEGTHGYRKRCYL